MLWLPEQRLRLPHTGLSLAFYIIEFQGLNPPNNLMLQDIFGARLV